MKVIYSIGSTFNQTGLGIPAYHAVSSIYKKGFLKRLICLDYIKSEILKEKIYNFWILKYIIWYPLKGFQRYFFKEFNPYIFLDKFYDFLSTFFVSSCDIFHYWRGHGFLAMRKAKRFGAITIIENGSSHPLTQKKLLEEEYEKFGLNFKPFTLKQLKNTLRELNFADYVEVQSKFAYQSFIENGFPKEKLILNPLGINISSKKFEKKKSKRFRVLFVGSVTLRKGIHYLLQAWDELHLKNAELIICGRVWEDAKEIVKKYQKNNSIKFLGFSTPDKYYISSNLFVFPSIEDGFAQVIAEAMSYSVPIVTTKNVGAADLISDDEKEGFIIPIRDVEAIKEKIKFMYDNPKICEKMGKAARKRVEKYSWENYGNNLIKEYQRILNEKKNKRI